MLVTCCDLKSERAKKKQNQQTDVLSKLLIPGKKNINFLFVFQGAANLEPSGTSANVRARERIAKQGFGQLLAFEISLGRMHLLVIKMLADEFTLLFFFPTKLFL